MIKLSILIPSIPERMINALQLVSKIQHLYDKKDIEILILTDNKIMTIGEKRNKLLKMAQGEYITFVDDDDDINEIYFEEIIPVIDNEYKVDLITFNQEATINGEKAIINFEQHNENEPFKAGEVINRMPFHVCVWKREAVQDIDFPAINYGEDAEWSYKANERVNKRVFGSIHIKAILHYYNYDSNKSVADQRVRDEQKQ